MKNESVRKLTEEARASISGLIASELCAALIKSTKAAGDADSGSFSVVASTSDRDRQNEIVDQAGWDLSYYKLNPVVLWAHDYGSLPIGVCTSIGVENGKLVASGKFAPADANPFAQQVRRLYDLGIVKTVSVGFLPHEFDSNDRDIVTKAELLEFSFCPVPANPFALSQMQIKRSGIDLGMVRSKGIEIEVKAPQIGDVCQLDDGTPGILAKDPKNPSGPMTCIPSKAMKHQMAVDCAFGGLDKAIEAFKSSRAAAYDEHASNHAKAIEVFKDCIKDCLKDVEISKSGESIKDISIFKDAFKSHQSAVCAENDRHAAAMDSHHVEVGKAIEVMRSVVRDAMKDYPMDPDSGDDVGGNPTADQVRMHQLIKETYASMNAICAALKDYAESEGGKKAEVQAPAPKVEPSLSDKAALDDLERSQGVREMIKTLDVTLGKVLRHYNWQDSRRAG